MVYGADSDEGVGVLRFISKLSLMKKLIVSVVLAAFLACTWLPAAVAMLTPTPACCRVHGEHHCVDTQSEDGHAIAATCPLRGRSLAVPANPAVLASRQHSFEIASFSFAFHLHVSEAATVALQPSGRSPPSFLA